MSDKEARLEILKKLKKSYDDDPHRSTFKDSLLNDLNIDSTELDRNIKYLKDKHLVEVKWFLGGAFMANITSYGIDVIEKYEETSKENIKVTTTDKKNIISSLKRCFGNRIVEGIIITVVGGIIVSKILL